MTGEYLQSPASSLFSHVVEGDRLIDALPVTGTVQIQRPSDLFGFAAGLSLSRGYAARHAEPLFQPGKALLLFLDHVGQTAQLIDEGVDLFAILRLRLT